MAKAIILDRLRTLENNIKELEKFKVQFSFQDIEQIKANEWAVRYGFFETIQIIIDISCHLASKYNLGNPESYSDCVRLLHQSDYINKVLSEKLIQMIGLKNNLIHDYISVDVKKLYEYLNNTGDFREFVNTIKDYV